MTSPDQLASEAIRLEQHVIKESVGSPDQVWAAMGGLGTITFHQTGKFEVKPLIISNERVKALNDCMMLFYSGQSRFASVVAAEQIEEDLAKRERQLHQMREFVDEGVKILQLANRPLDDLGRLPHEVLDAQKGAGRWGDHQQGRRDLRGWHGRWCGWRQAAWGRRGRFRFVVCAARVPRRDKEASQGSDRGQRQDQQSRQRHRAVCAGSIARQSTAGGRRRVACTVAESCA